MQSPPAACDRPRAVAGHLSSGAGLEQTSATVYRFVETRSLRQLSKLISHRLRTDLEQVRAGIANAETFAATLPDRERYLRLVHSLDHRLIDAFDDWLEELENCGAVLRAQEITAKSTAHLSTPS